MNKNGIDDLLKIVDPKLVTGYVARNFTAGSSLHAVNEEYKAVTQQTGMSFDDCLKLILFSLVIGFLLYFYLWYKGVPVYVSAIAMVVLVLPIELYLLFPVRWKFENDRATQYRCEPILRDFRQAVEALNPLGVTEKMPEHNSDSVWGTLFLLAVRVLEAKDEFIEACKSENPAMVRVQKIIVWEQDCRKRFNHMFEATTEFGMDFSKQRIYQAAQDEIDQRSEWSQFGSK